MDQNKVIASSCHNSLISIVHNRDGKPIKICKMCGNICEEHEIEKRYLVIPKYKNIIIFMENATNLISNSKFKTSWQK